MIEVRNDGVPNAPETLYHALSWPSFFHGTAGGKKDSWLIDYQATKNVLDIAREKGASHFVLLSAICVQKPLLEFQKAKLKLEVGAASS